MSQFAVKTLPRGAKPDQFTTVADLTKEVFVTNDQKMAYSSVDGSLRPMAVIKDGIKVYDNFAKTLGVLTKRENAWVKAGQEADRQAHARRPQQAPKQGRRQQPERGEKRPSGSVKGRFDHVKPIREVIVERV